MNPDAASSKRSRDCFALFDDCDATPASPRSRLYTGHAGTLVCNAAAALPGMLEGMQQALARGLHVVVACDYELGAAMHGIPPRERNAPLAQVLLFSQCAHLSADDVAAWLAQQDRDAQPAGVTHLTDSVDEAQFKQAIGRIRDYIEAGDTYQVNYTYRIRFDAYGSPLALYRRLRARQPVPYGVLIALPDGRDVLSLSPELFVQHSHGVLTTRPMKGTARASGVAQQDADRAAALANDTKNRAENLMIVDLLRNDLGRVARTGSVRVPSLFQVDRYASVLQMTSTVEAELRSDATLVDVFTALYPCGSITGAPKRRTMQIIRELEPDARGIYTGAIGWFDAPDEARDLAHLLGDFCMSVPIRTLTLQAAGASDTSGMRKGEMGVGAGIVHDSDPTDEYAECKLKASFLTGLPQEFELIETMQATQAGCALLELHLQRLRASAERFDFRFDEAALRTQLSQAFAAMNGAYRLRLALAADGRCTLQSAPLVPLAEPVRLLLAEERTMADDIFLSHKTTVRERYDRGWRAAEAEGAFDMLFFNTDDELTEGGRSNVFLKLDGCWVTPPLQSGVLPGVMRRVLLEDAAWGAQERRLTREDLLRAEEIVVCNALRGVLKATL